MSLSQKIAAALDAHPAAGPVSVQDGSYSLALDVSAAGPVGLAFDSLVFTVTDRPEWSSDALKAWGARIASRVTYLMEPLVVLEIDAQGGEVELRSQSPTARDGRRTYYEVRLNRSGSVRLARVAYDEQARRRTAATCQMTREVLERLTDDLVASVG